jgi:hypothetical protein
MGLIWADSFTDTRAIAQPSRHYYCHSLSFENAIVVASTFDNDSATMAIRHSSLTRAAQVLHCAYQTQLSNECRPPSRSSLRNAMSVPSGFPHRRLSNLIFQYADQMDYISITNLSSRDRRCALCRWNMCVYHPHTCYNDLECENAHSLKVCGHIAGQKCLLRALEKRPLCPICRHVIFAPRVVVATTLEERNDTASDRTIGVALSWQVA